MTTWQDYKTNGRDFKDLIHPSGVDNDKYYLSGLESANKIKKDCFLNKNHKILEYGCGNGRILKHLQDYNIYGVDLVKDFLNDGREQRIKNLYHLNDNLNILFDVIFSYTVFIHLNNEDTISALKYIYNHLNKNGKAYLQIPLYEVGTNHDGNFICVRTWETDKLFPILENMGFKILNYKINKGKFDYNNIGQHHEEFLVLSK
jgi:SAM-dependent methyltransferase